MKYMREGFELNPEDLTDINFINPKFGYQEFEVDAGNYKAGQDYCCEKGHRNLHKPALYPSAVSFNPKTGAFEMRGTVVMICGICKSPLQPNDD